MGNTIFNHEQRQKCDDVMKKVHFWIFHFHINSEMPKFEDKHSFDSIVKL